MTIDAIVYYLRPLVALSNNYPLHFTLLVVMTLDIFTGIAAAFGTKVLSSNIAWKGIMRKAATWAIVALAQVIEPLLGGDLPIAKLVIMGFVFSEGLSILENGGRLGVVSPIILRNALTKLQQQAAVVVQTEQATINLPDGSIPGGRRINDPPVMPDN